MVLQIHPGHIVDAQRQVAILHLFDSRSSICEELLWCHFISLPPPLRACLYYLVARQACKVDVIVPVSFRHQCLYCLFVCIVYCLYCLLFILFIACIVYCLYYPAARHACKVNINVCEFPSSTAPVAKKSAACVIVPVEPVGTGKATANWWWWWWWW